MLVPAFTLNIIDTLPIVYIHAGGCGGFVSVAVDTNGVLTSPEFPGNYPSNIKCVWMLVAERDCDVVKITFTHIILEEGYDTLSLCLKDKCSEEEKMVLTGEKTRHCA